MIPLKHKGGVVGQTIEMDTGGRDARQRRRAGCDRGERENEIGAGRAVRQQHAHFAARRSDRPPFLYWGLLWSLGSVLALVSIGADILIRNMGRALGRDFSNEWVAGRLALDGQSWCIFDQDCFRVEMWRRIGVLNLQNFSYPPHTLFLDVPFALVPYYVGLGLWTVFGCTLFYWAAKPALPEGFKPIWVLLTPAALINIWNGHYGFVLGALWLLCFRNLEERPVKSGVAAGLLTFKPHMGLMIALAAATNWRAFLSAAVTAVVLVLASAVAFGPSSWFDFLTATTAAQADVLTRSTGDFYFRMMPSSYVAYGQGPVAISAQVLFGLGAMFLIARSRKVDPFTFATATFLIVPYVFNYDMGVACLGFAILLWARWAELNILQRTALSVAFVSPELTYFANWLVPPVLMAALYVQTSPFVGSSTSQSQELPGPDGAFTIR